MADQETGGQPPQIARADTLRSHADVLHQYADVLRVGRLLSHGREITWDTRVSNEGQLEGFCKSFIAALRLVPELQKLHHDVLLQAAHLFCKALSINYFMAEMMELFRRRLGKHPDGDGDRKPPFLCSIRSGGESAHTSVDYHMEVLEGQLIRARASWRGKNNIVSCDPKSGAIKVRGTLYHVETEYPILIERFYKPTYRLQTDLRPSSRMALTSKFASPGGTPASEAEPVETVFAKSPLFFDGLWTRRRMSVHNGALSLFQSAENLGDEDSSEGESADCLGPFGGGGGKMESLSKVQKLFGLFRNSSVSA